MLEAALEALALSKQAVHWEAEGARAFIQVVHPPERLIVLGTTLVAESLCELASRAGFEVSVEFRRQIPLRDRRRQPGAVRIG